MPSRQADVSVFTSQEDMDAVPGAAGVKRPREWHQPAVPKEELWTGKDEAAASDDGQVKQESRSEFGEWSIHNTLHILI